MCKPTAIIQQIINALFFLLFRWTNSYMHVIFYLALEKSIETGVWQVKQLVGEELFGRYDRLLLQSSLDSMADVTYCPRHACATAVLVEPDDSSAICSSCRYAFCTLCRQGYHGLSPCAERRPREERAPSADQPYAPVPEKEGLLLCILLSISKFSGTVNVLLFIYRVHNMPSTPSPRTFLIICSCFIIHHSKKIFSLINDVFSLINVFIFVKYKQSKKCMPATNKKGGTEAFCYWVTSPFLLITLCNRLGTEDINCYSFESGFFCPFLVYIRLELLNSPWSLILLFVMRQTFSIGDCRQASQAHTHNAYEATLL